MYFSLASSNSSSEEEESSSGEEEEDIQEDDGITYSDSENEEPDTSRQSALKRTLTPQHSQENKRVRFNSTSSIELVTDDLPSTHQSEDSADSSNSTEIMDQDGEAGKLFFKLQNSSLYSMLKFVIVTGESILPSKELTGNDSKSVKTIQLKKSMTANEMTSSSKTPIEPLPGEFTEIISSFFWTFVLYLPVVFSCTGCSNVVEISIGNNRLRSDDEDSLEELLTSRRSKSKSTKPRSTLLTSVKVNQTSQSVTDEKPKGHVNLKFTGETNQSRESGKALSNDTAFSASRNAVANKLEVNVIIEAPPKMNQTTAAYGVVPIDKMLPDFTSKKFHYSEIIFDGKSSLSASDALRLCKLQERLRNKFPKPANVPPGALWVTPNEKLKYRLLRQSLRCKSRLNNRVWKVTQNSSKPIYKKVLSGRKQRLSNWQVAIKNVEQSPTRLNLFSGIKLDSTAPASTSSPKALCEDFKLQISSSSDASKDSENLIPVAQLRDKEVARAETSLYRFSAPPASSTPTNSATVCHGGSSSSDTVCYGESSFKNASPNSNPFLFNNVDSGITADGAGKSSPSRETSYTEFEKSVKGNLMGFEPSVSDSELMEEIGKVFHRFIIPLWA